MCINLSCFEDVVVVHIRRVDVCKMQGAVNKEKYM